MSVTSIMKDGYTVAQVRAGFVAQGSSLHGWCSKNGTRAGIGKLCYIVDDQTVAATHATNSRSPAGIVEGIDNGGVWVRLDEAVTRGAV